MNREAGLWRIISDGLQSSGRSIETTRGNCFIVVRDRRLDIGVYRGSDAVDLRMDGFAAVQALAVFEEPYDWSAFFELTAPV